MKSTERFSSRVEDYARYRPAYPPEVVAYLEDAGSLFPGVQVADVGSGTGIFAELLLESGYEVIGVEPNAAMRAAAEVRLEGRSLFRGIAPTPAEQTGLGAASVDLVTAAQALHWFDPDRTRAEFLRITRPPHRLAAIWNIRTPDASPFLRDYEELVLAHGIGYPVRSQEDIEARMHGVFGHADLSLFTTPNQQRFDLEGLTGRLLSSSYAPKPDMVGYGAMVSELERVFKAHEVGGTVDILYETSVHLGEIRP